MILVFLNRQAAHERRTVHKCTRYECCTADKHEQLAPSLAPNPTLRSFLDVLAELRANANADISVDDFPTELNSVEASEAALRADQDIQSLFPDLKVCNARPACHHRSV